MSFFEGQDGGWSQRHSRQQSWDPSTPSARPGASAPSQQLDETDAFTTQYEEIDRARDNLAKSGKFPAQFGGNVNMHNRRESMPTVGTFSRQLAEFDPRGGPSRHFSVSEDPSRSHSGSQLQGYLSHQRFGPRPSEAEQVMQAKRRAAAARERELRNYHQEQQYNRSGSRTSQTFDASTPSEKEPSGPKSDRSMSPNAAMSEDERRELIARQHRALYGNDSQLYLNDASASRTLSQDARVLAATSSPHGSSPLAFDAFGVPSTSSGDSGIPLQAATGQSSTRASSTTPPSGAPKQFAMFDNGPQQGVKCSSPGPAPAQNGSKGGPGNGVAPIGTRPAQAAGKAGNRGPPSAPSPLGFNGVNINERSQSSASNPNNGNGNGNGDKAPGLGWSGSNGPWGSKMQASVWG